MSILDAVTGKRATLPPGARAFVAMSVDGSRFTVRYAEPGEEQSMARPRVPRSPVFSRQVEAYRWLTCFEDGTEYSYPEGRV